MKELIDFASLSSWKKSDLSIYPIYQGLYLVTCSFPCWLQGFQGQYVLVR